MPSALSASIIVSAEYRLFLAFFFFFSVKQFSMKKNPRNIGNKVTIVIKHLERNQISVLNNPLVDIPLNK